MATKPKPRLGVMIRQSFEESPNQCAELDALKERYKKLCQKMTVVDKALKLRHASLVNTGKSRAAVADALYAMSENTPVQDSASLQKEQMKKMAETSVDRADEFKMFAMDYFTEWQAKVTTRINKDIKDTDQLRRDADHYQAKVTSLEQGVTALTDKKKPVPPAKTEQLYRNQEKLREANQLYQNAARDLFLIMEELVDRSWRDLHPLLLKLLNFDIKNVNDAQSVATELETAMLDLKQIKKKDSEIPESTQKNRLGRLEQATPQEIGKLASDNGTPGSSQRAPTNKSSNPSSVPSSRKQPSPSNKKPTLKPVPPPVPPPVNNDNGNPKKSWFNRNQNQNQELLDSDDSSVDDKDTKTKPVSARNGAPPPNKDSKKNPSGGGPKEKNNPYDEDTPPSKKWNERAPAKAASSRAAPVAPKTTSKKPASAPKSPASPGKVAKVQQRAGNDGPVDPYEGADPSKWRTKEMQFGGSFTYETKGQSEEVIGSSIKKGIEKFKANPKKYVCIFHQSNMLDWPTDHQRYVMIHREGTAGYVPQNVGKGPMTLYMHTYERLPAFPDDELPQKYRDKYTDNMAHQGYKLHSAKNLPIMPGRGMGVCDTPTLKIIGDVDPSDIHQGTVGDCWLLSGISSLAEFDGAIKRLFRKTTRLDQRPLEGPNMYIVTLWDLETWTERDIEIDERLPVMADGSRKLLASKPSQDGELWACYLEKALAVHCGGWDKITGGQCTHAWSLLTGCKEQYTIRINEKTKKFQCFGKYDPQKKQWIRHANCPHDGDKVTWPMAWPKVSGGEDMHTEITEEELFQKMVRWDQENYIIGAGCQSKAGDKGLVDNHAYSVIECLSNVAGTGIDMVKVRNPWGSGEIDSGMFDDDGNGWTKYPQIKKLLNPVVADDGIFWVTKQEFFKFFATIYLSASNMTEFLED